MTTQTSLRPGDRITVRDAFGNTLSRRAVTSVVPGHEFDVVWACREEEWVAAQADGREPAAMPWPVEDVSPLP